MGIRKKIIIGWLGFEAIALVLAIPALGQIRDRVMFEAVPRAAHVVNEINAGTSEILVASNAPFMLISEGAIGEMKLQLNITGFVNGVSHGKNAQSPGPILNCVNVQSDKPSILYLSARKTAANRGAVIDQAVKIIVRHDQNAKPKFNVKTLDQELAKTAITADPCEIKISSAESFLQTQ